MKSFTIPAKLNGKQLRAEIEQAGIKINDFPTITDDQLFLDISDTDFDKVQKIVENHQGQNEPDYRQSALAKLAALGLTEDEIAAL